LQKKDGQFTRSKSFDTFSPLGPWIETDIPDPDHLRVEGYLNGERRQHSNTSNMVFGVAYLVSFISRIMTLLPGDVIATGTPSGIGPMRPGDVVEVRVEGIGTLRNRLVAGRVE
jgi:2-keto-4-pentenoate hydratase/2-oxohepta-3-ene-1,7-dioic acid hydratase in catechol pathway